MNGMVYMRGQPADYEAWADAVDGPPDPVSGVRPWSWDDMRPLFNLELDYQAGESRSPGGEVYGTGGRYVVANPRLHWDVLDAWAKGCAEVGLPLRSHFNDSATEGVGYFEVTQREGWRNSVYRAHLHRRGKRDSCLPVHRPNLSIATNSHASRILMEKASDGSLAVSALDFWRRAPLDGLRGFVRGALNDVGVGMSPQDDRRKDRLARARVSPRGGQLVLAAGAIGSPQLLMASGIGEGGELRDLGIEPLLDLPGVGKNLHDHLQVRASFRLHDGCTTLNQQASTLFGRAKLGLQYLRDQTGPLSMAPSQMGVFARSSPAEATPDLQWHVQPLSLDAWDQPLDQFPGLTASVCNLRPTSRGTVRLQSPDTRDPPLIDPKFLDTARDREVAVRALKWTRKIAHSAAVQAGLGAVEHRPGAAVTSDEDLAAAAGEVGTSIFHPVSTCRMGREEDPEAVVDQHLSLRGVRGVTIADGSVMPRITSGNTNAPIMAIGEKAAGILLARRRGLLAPRG